MQKRLLWVLAMSLFVATSHASPPTTEPPSPPPPNAYPELEVKPLTPDEWKQRHMAHLYLRKQRDVGIFVDRVNSTLPNHHFGAPYTIGITTYPKLDADQQEDLRQRYEDAGWVATLLRSDGIAGRTRVELCLELPKE